MHFCVRLVPVETHQTRYHGLAAPPRASLNEVASALTGSIQHLSQPHLALGPPVSARNLLKFASNVQNIHSTAMKRTL